MTQDEIIGAIYKVTFSWDKASEIYHVLNKDGVFNNKSKKFYEYETKDGRLARIVCTNMKLIRPVIVLILQDDGTEKIERLTIDLKYMVTAVDAYITKRI